MSLELEVDDAERPVGTRSRREDEAPYPGRPDVPGDLDTMFRAAPLFGRAVAGYDRFQVDTYVRWAEEELATAEREREHLMTRHVRTRAELDDARRLLAHSPAGAELLQVSGRIGELLAAAADEADGIRAEARAELSAATRKAEHLLARADETVRAAQAWARRLVADATAEAARVTGEATRVLADAEATHRRSCAEAAARAEELRLLGERAAEHAARLRQETTDEVAAVLLRARAEVVAMLDTGRELRRRADEAAAASRARLDREATARRAALLTDVAQLERRRAALQEELGPPVGAEVPPPGRRLAAALRRAVEGAGGRSRALRTP